MKTLLKKYLPPSIQSLIFSVINTAKNFKKTVTGETKSPYGDEYKNFICPNPFSYMEFMVGGGVHTCCYLSQAFGNLKNENFMDAWNSEEAVKIRKSILDGDFRYCNKQKCAAMQQYKYDSSKKAYPYRLIKKDSLTDPYLKNIVANNITRLSNGPKIISFDNDPSCNLYCPSCRKQRLSLSGKQFQEAKALTEKLLKSIKNDVEELWFAGSGDPFASRIYRDFFQNFDPNKYPKVKFRFDTNGQLLTKKTWDTLLTKIQDRIKVIAVSVDATTAKTYTQTRRGGDFKILMQNLNFISKLKQRKHGMQFWIRLIVQKKNYKEMKQFIQLGKKLKVDTVIFSTLSNWGTFTDEEYQDNAIHLPSHPDHHQLIKILKNPIFKDKIVDLGNLTAYYHSLTQTKSQL